MLQLKNVKNWAIRE